MERYALASHQRALRAIDERRLRRRDRPLRGREPATRARAADTTLEKMAGLKPLREGGRITAALASQISDGAAALLIASDRAVREHKLTAEGPDPPPVRPRRRPRAHADRAHRRDRARAAPRPA